LLNIYRVQGKTILAVQLQYRIGMVIWMIGLILEPVIYLVVWTTVARSTGGHVGTFSSGAFAAYFIVLMLVNHATFSWVIWGFDARIRQGILSPMLLRPVHPFHADLCENLSFKLLMLVVMAPATVLLAIAFHPVLHPPRWAILLFPVVLGLAIVMRFTLEWAIALVAFWISRMNAMNQMYYVAVLFLSGQVAPLSLFPGPIRTIAAALPFRWMIAFPVELLLGRIGPQAALTGVAIQIVWLAVAVGALKILWRFGTARYSAVGS